MIDAGDHGFPPDPRSRIFRIASGSASWLKIAEAGNCPAKAHLPRRAGLADHIILRWWRTIRLITSHQIAKDASRLGIPHAYGFVIIACSRYAAAKRPVIFNVHYEPNRQAVRRCFALGRAWRRAIKD